MKVKSDAKRGSLRASCVVDNMVLEKYRTISVWNNRSKLNDA
jgi:hypothetical protein